MTGLWWVGGTPNHETDWHTATNWSSTYPAYTLGTVPTINNYVYFGDSGNGHDCILTAPAYAGYFYSIAVFPPTYPLGWIKSFNSNGFSLNVSVGIITYHGNFTFDSVVIRSVNDYSYFIIRPDTLVNLSNCDVDIYSSAAYSQFYISVTGVSLKSAKFSGVVKLYDTYKTSQNWSTDRLYIQPGAEVVAALGTTITVNNYETGDWGGTVSSKVDLKSSSPGTPFIISNPSGMIVQNMIITDCIATNIINATNNCVDGAGNTNWIFSTVFSNCAVEMVGDGNFTVNKSEIGFASVKFNAPEKTIHSTGNIWVTNRLYIQPGTNFVRKHGSHIIFNEYISGDWDGISGSFVNISSDLFGVPFNFVNPANMTVYYLNISDRIAYNNIKIINSNGFFKQNPAVLKIYKDTEKLAILKTYDGVNWRPRTNPYGITIRQNPAILKTYDGISWRSVSQVG